MISEIILEILNDLGNYLLGSPFSAFVHSGSLQYSELPSKKIKFDSDFS